MGKLRYGFSKIIGSSFFKDLGGHDDWVRDVAWCNNIGLL